jgi:hypothetical protein
LALRELGTIAKMALILPIWRRDLTDSVKTRVAQRWINDQVFLKFWLSFISART